MRDLVIMPAMAQRRESLNMGEFAEEAIIVEEDPGCRISCVWNGIKTAVDSVVSVRRALIFRSP